MFTQIQKNGQFAIMLNSGEILAVSFSSYARALAAGEGIGYTLFIDFRIVSN